MPREIREEQKYKDRLLKLIPSEIIAAYLILEGIIPSSSAKWGTLIVSVILLILVPFYLWRIQEVKRTAQIIVTTISFAVWVYTMGGPFQEWDLFKPFIGSIILVLWTLIIPIVVNPKPQTNP